MAGIDRALSTGEGASEAFALCEVLPGDGFTWNPKTGSLCARIPAAEVPTPELTEELLSEPLVQRVLAIRAKLDSKGGANGGRTPRS